MRFLAPHLVDDSLFCAKIYYLFSNKFLLINYLKEKGVKHMVSICNDASLLFDKKNLNKNILTEDTIN